MRLIDADALKAYWQPDHDREFSADYFIHTIDVAPTIETEQKWIPVTERLPETPGEYMVAYHPCYSDSVQDEIKVGLDSFRGKTAWAKKKYQRVTHWMPLPEMPKEET